jgi:lipopolysaccharide transport system ATP-binding protein
MNKKEDAVIILDHVSKLFQLPVEKRKTLFEEVSARIRGRHGYMKLWALKNINLLVRKGEFIGIIGPNGSGKSTLLKIIARIMPPTQGKLLVKGKIVPFLELGVGFQDDLTARENIYLYSALMGLTRSQVNEKMEKIISFAGLKEFAETPLKDFSDGMKVRLAFSTAIATDGDTYLVDEVLAVGDMDFQRKCYKVFADFKKKGKTIIFVSHNLAAVEKFCDRVVLLDKGRVVSEGKPEKAIKAYYQLTGFDKDNGSDKNNNHEEALAKVKELKEHELKEEANKIISRRKGSREIEITKVSFIGKDGKEKKTFQTRRPFKIIIAYDAKKRIREPMFGIGFFDSKGVYLIGPNTIFSGYKISSVYGKGVVVYELDSLPFLPGEYFVSVAVHNKQETKCYDFHDKLYKIRIAKGGTNEKYGLIELPCKWMHQAGGTKKK